MRTAKLKLTAAVLASAGLLGLAGVGTFTALGQQPAPTPRTKGEPPPPPAKEGPFAERPKLKEADAFTAFPDLDSKNLEDLTTKCPHLLAKEDIPVLPTDDPLRQLQKARLNAIRRAVPMYLGLVQAGRLGDALAVPGLMNRAVAAAADLYPDPKELRPWLEERVRVAKCNEKLFDYRWRVGRSPESDVLVARAARLEAEAALWKAKHPKPAGK